MLAKTRLKSLIKQYMPNDLKRLIMRLKGTRIHKTNKGLPEITGIKILFDDSSPSRNPIINSSCIDNCEEFSSFVSSRGLAKSCSNHNKILISSCSAIDEDLLRNLQKGSSIYVCSDALINFARFFLDHISQPFVLVSGDSDITIDEDLLTNIYIKNMLKSDKLIGWFAQNLSSRHPKLFQSPIGIDYHTHWNNYQEWGSNKSSALAQEASLLEIASDSKFIKDRELISYSNWHFFKERGDRQDCYNQIDKNATFFEPKRVSRLISWKRQSECMFVLSPQGVGMDCHRTWESILLGNIVIAKHSQLDGLYRNLPVILVDRWSDVNQDLLKKSLSEMINQKFDFSPLFLQHWAAKINQNKKQFLLERMSLDEFKHYISKQIY